MDPMDSCNACVTKQDIQGTTTTGYINVLLRVVNFGRGPVLECKAHHLFQQPISS